MAFTRPKASSTARGYGQDHRRKRAAALAELQQAGVGVCCLGGEPILPGQRLHLDHCPTCKGHGCSACGGVGYRGLACARHNVRDGAKRARARQNTTRLAW